MDGDIGLIRERTLPRLVLNAAQAGEFHAPPAPILDFFCVEVLPQEFLFIQHKQSPGPY